MKDDVIYTCFGWLYDQVYVTGYRNGKKFHDKIPYSPFLFIPGNGEYKTVYGKPLRRMDFNSVKEARYWTKERSDKVDGQGNSVETYGLGNYPYVYIYENFKSPPQDLSIIRVGNFDIETDSQDGYGSIHEANRAIISITMKVHGEKTFYVLGMKPYQTKEKELLDLIADGYKIVYTQCQSEAELLRKFIKLWVHLNIDIITGFNIEMFDIPVTVKRINKVLGEEWARKLSPYNKIEKTEIEIYGKKHDKYELIGLPILDFLPIYKKFTQGNEEAYNLNYLSGKVLGTSKLDYSEYKTLARLWNENHDKFIDYNIIDVHRVEQLDQYLKYIQLAMIIAYFSGTNYVDTFGTIRVWDIMIHNYLMDQKIAVPYSVTNRKLDQIAGGHVKDPQTGKHKCVMSFDFTSLYPHLTMMFNISPDTLMGKFDPVIGDQSVDKILNGALKEHRQDMTDSNVVVSGRGTVFSRDREGFIPALMKKLFKQRKKYTKLEEDHDEYLAKVNAEIYRRGI